VKKSSKSVIEMRVLETNPEFKYLEESIETINTQLVALVSPEVRFVATIYRSMVVFVLFSFAHLSL